MNRSQDPTQPLHRERLLNLSEKKEVSQPSQGDLPPEIPSLDEARAVAEDAAIEPERSRDKGRGEDDAQG